MADAAATIIANAVDLPGHPNVVRVPANSLAPDSDLGDRLVTQGVGELSPSRSAAFDAGALVAPASGDGSIRSAALHLRGDTAWSVRTIDARAAAEFRFRVEQRFSVH